MKTWKKIVVFFGMLAIISVVAFYFLVYNKPHIDYERAKAEFQLSAQELYYAFAEDEPEAELRYAGRVIAIDGSVGYVEDRKDMVIVGFVFQDGLFGPEGIRCIMLPNHESRARELNEGENIHVQGLCTGFSGHDVIMEHCSFLD